MYTHEARERVAAARDPLPVTDRPMPPVSARLWPGFTRYLSQRGLSAPLARENGWYPSEDVPGDAPGVVPRIVIPATASAGHIYWQARAMGPWEPRYRCPRYPRRDAIVWTWPERSRARGVVVVEGPMDALAAAEVGFYGAAMMGVDPPYAAITFLALWCRRHAYVQKAVIVPDGDASGPTLSKVALVLASLGIDAYTLTPRDKDLASMSAADRKEFLAC